MTSAIKAKTIVPIHSFRGNEYKQHFNYPILEVKDWEEILILKN